MRYTLCTIHYNHCAYFVCAGHDFLYRIDTSENIGYLSHCHQFCLLIDYRLNRFICQCAVSFTLHKL